ncbi:MAG: Gfo/Idh/MocA family oxidoreductase [Planctomycetales bacterium]|nr:Gfo/Idh/MocA family oxidoreductase [Planctomycetales bacterium]
MQRPAHELIREAIAANQIGQPVAARVFRVTEATARESLAASELREISRWLQDEPASLHASIAGEQLTVLARFHRGGSALVSIASTDSPAKARHECIVWGQLGTLHWVDGAAGGGVSSDRNAAPLADDDELTNRIRTAIVGPSESSADELTLSAAPFPAREQPEQFAFAPCQPPYGVLLVAGDHTHQPGYAEAFLADGRAKLVAVADEADASDRRHELNERFAKRLGIPYVRDLNQAISDPAVQIVCVCAEPMRRGRIIAAAARQGKHLYLDKPLAGSQSDARLIADAARTHRVASHMFSQVNWSPAADAREAVRSGRLGQLSAIHCDLCFAKGIPGTADLAQARRESATPDCFELPDAKRELTNVGVYCVTFLLWLMQRPVRRVWATTGNYFFAEHQHHDMEDFGQMLLEFDGGVTASVTAGRTGWQSHPGFGLNRIYMVGSQGQTVFDSSQSRLECWGHSSNWTPPARDPEDPMGMWMPLPDSPYRAAAKQAWRAAASMAWAEDVKHFLDRLQAGQPSEVPAELAAAATHILFAAYRSAATGQPVRLVGDE